MYDIESQRTYILRHTEGPVVSQTRSTVLQQRQAVVVPAAEAKWHRATVPPPQSEAAAAHDPRFGVGAPCACEEPGSMRHTSILSGMMKVSLGVGSLPAGSTRFLPG